MMSLRGRRASGPICRLVALKPVRDLTFAKVVRRLILPHAPNRAKMISRKVAALVTLHVRERLHVISDASNRCLTVGEDPDGFIAAGAVLQRSPDGDALHRVDCVRWAIPA